MYTLSIYLLNPMAQLYKKVGLLLLGLAVGAGTGQLGWIVSDSISGSGGLPLALFFGLAVVLAAYLLLATDLNKSVLVFLAIFGIYMGAVLLSIMAYFLLRGHYTAAGNIAGGILFAILLPKVLEFPRRNWLIVGAVLVGVAGIGIEVMISKLEVEMSAPYQDVPARPGVAGEWGYWSSISPVVWQSIMLGFTLVELYAERLRRLAVKQA
jgi:hypothetical protein